MSDRAPPLIERRSLLAGGSVLGASMLLSACGVLPGSGGKRSDPPPPPIARGGARLTPRWTAAFPGAVNRSPAATAAGIWAAGDDGRLALLDPATGAPRWTVVAGRSIVAGVGARERIGVVATAEGRLIAFEADGRRLWSADLGAEAVTIPAVGERAVFVRASDRRVLAFDLASGRRLWSVTRSGPALVLRQTSLITLADTRLFLGFPGGRLAAFGQANGVQAWDAAVTQPRGSNEIERIADVVGAPSFVSQDVCAVAFQGRIGCFDAATGRTLWSRELSSPTGLAGTAAMLAVADERGHLHAFSRTGASLWRQTGLAERTPSTPAFADRRLIVGDVGGFVYALSLDDGNILARAATGGRPIQGAPVIAGDLVLVQSRQGALHALAIGPA
jgi:outer membrane protein assembly factor BamB